MFQSTQSNSNLPRNYLQFHENAFVSPLNLINVTHPAPVSFGRAPHVLQQTIPRIDTSIPSLPTSSSSSVLPHLQSIDANKLHMYQFLAQRKLKEDRWKKEITEKNTPKQTFQQRNVRSSQSQQRPQKPPIRSASAPKKTTTIKKSTKNEINRSQIIPTSIHFTRPDDPFTALSLGKQNEITDVHEQLLVQLRILHNPPARENIIDETEQEKQRRIRLKRERIKRDSRAIYNAHQELKQILIDIRQPDANIPRLTHRHLNAYKAVLLAMETLANEAPLKSQDAPVQQLYTSIIPVLETLTNTNYALGLSQLQIDRSYLHVPPSKSVTPRATSNNRVAPPNQLLPTIYNELIKKKQQQQKPRVIPSVLRPRSAESIRLPRTNTSKINRSTISMQHKTRARSHSPLPSIKSASTIETPFHSRFTVDHILVKLAPKLLANYNGNELSKQIERARTLIPMFLVDNRLSDDEITTRVIQMLMPRQDHQIQPSTTHFAVLETPEEHARRVNIDVYQTQITTWEDEMSQIRQRLQNYRTNRLEDETAMRQTIKFQVNSSSTPTLPENVHIHTPLFEHTIDDFVTKSNENNQAFEITTMNSSPSGNVRLYGLDSSKIRQIERYKRDYQSYLQRTESAKIDDFDPCQVINRLSEFLLDEALISVVHEVELLTVELSQKLVENELLGREISLTDVDKRSKRPLSPPQQQQQQQQQQYRRPVQQIDRQHSPISPSPPIEQYNTSSFEEDLNTESKISRSEYDTNVQRRKSPMEGTGRFVSAAFEQRRLPKDTTSSSSSRNQSPVGIILKPTISIKKPNSIHEEINQMSDRESSSSSTISKRHQQKLRRQSSADEDDDLLYSTKTGEKIYSTDFDESKSKPRHISSSYDDEDDDDIADTMKLSARSLNAAQQSSSDEDEN
ncbi:unnamed protein product [Adineta steineri]|uniref:Uncharacterized protein n=1 Tax=Adineta steineri TaxID=433720 RepID=A0A819IB49_9BILA|nr:unnamed protein product [Adineta steineri]